MRHPLFHWAFMLAAAAHGIWFGACSEARGASRKIAADEIATPGVVDLSARPLRAGPIRLKLQDGQLRYLRVGDKEIVRRVYFAVRDGSWATAMPMYTLMEIDDGGDHFAVRMAATCRMGAVDYSWTGTIVGTTDGKITFRAEGTPNASFDSNRIGLCVLYGTPSLANQEFETDGAPARGTFPALVSPVHVAEGFHRLQYSTDAGLTVACSVEGATLDMEDQRNWGDSSWKAFAPLPYAYKTVGKGDVKSETVTFTVSGANTANSRVTAEEPVRITVGQPVPGVRLPGLSASTSGTAPVEFSAISFKRDALKGKDRIDWSYIPTTHLPDDDTIMENLPAVADQANTVLGFSLSHPQVHVGPIRLDAKGEDARSANTPLGAAWLVGMVDFLARGHVHEASFDLSGERPAAALEAIRPYARWQMLAVETSPKDSTRLLAFGCFNENEQVLFLINRGPLPTRVVLDRGATEARVLHVSPGAKEEAIHLSADGLKVQLKGYEVYRVTFRGHAN